MTPLDSTANIIKGMTISSPVHDLRSTMVLGGSCLHAYCPTDDPDTRGTVLCLDVGANYLATVRPSASFQSNLVPEQLCKGRYGWSSKPNLLVLKTNLMAVSSIVTIFLVNAACAVR